jgi:GTP-binding protein
MKFIDQTKITVTSGKGGPGCVSFMRGMHMARGGPNGGDGGKGGDLGFRVNLGINSLLDISLRKHYAAQDGQPGAQQDCTGADGEDLILEVPQGTVIKDEDGQVLLDLSEKNQEVIFLKGGRGGKGNTFFKTSTNQAPTHAQPGEPKEEKVIILELKLIADVGLVGYPNAGKSTLISSISAAKPKIADYPFTTLTPNLGVVRYGHDKTFVVADIPGIIPGASQGVGLGTQFLRHIERTKCFLHIIDISPFSARDPLQDYADINHELEEHDRLNTGKEGFFSLRERKQIVVLNKMDTMKVTEAEEIQSRFKEEGIETILVSAATGNGIKDLIFKAGDLVFGEHKHE